MRFKHYPLTAATSVLSGVLVGCSFGISLGGGFHVPSLFQPAVFTIASTVGGGVGLILSPWVHWVVGDLPLLRIMPPVIVTTVISTVALNQIHGIAGALGAFLSAVIAMLITRDVIRKRLHHQGNNLPDLRENRGHIPTNNKLTNETPPK